MEQKKLLSSVSFGDMVLNYVVGDESHLVGLVVVPEQLQQNFHVDGEWRVDSLVQVKLTKDKVPVGFSSGHSMRNSETVQKLYYKEQKISGQGVETVLESEDLQVIHRITYVPETLYVWSETEVRNRSGKKVSMELLSSFSLSGFPALDSKERMEDMNLYRLRSKWSCEGRLEKDTFVDLQLEPSWQKFGVQSIRFGEIGSMPVRMYFPWAAVEDEKYHMMTGAQIYHNGSWQMEVYDRDDKAALSGGLADREFGHWVKNLDPGERFTSPRSVITTCVGDVDEISYRLTQAQKESRENRPQAEQNLPMMFNEFCTTWGNPTVDTIRKIVHKIAGKGLKYCIIDAGWYACHEEEGDWNGDMGDWEISEKRFPGGFYEIVKEIRDAGMIPGLWYEFENVGANTKAFAQEDWQLKRDGYPIQAGPRRFFDMRNPEVVKYLDEKVIALLKKYQFGYLKVDYNDNIGVGCDGAESLGEGLRQYVKASHDFFKHIHEELPELVIENCASGGHRLEPSMQAVTSLASFSDAHECLSIPVIAANVHRAILPEQSQIWAVVREKDSDQRLYYTMVNTFLGRMCLSGDIHQLSEQQWRIVDDGIAFYKEAAPLIKEGKSIRRGQERMSYEHPGGYQAVMRMGIDPRVDFPKKILVIVHQFSFDETKTGISLSLPEGYWKVVKEYHRNVVSAELTERHMRISGMEEFEGAAFILERVIETREEGA